MRKRKANLTITTYDRKSRLDAIDGLRAVAVLSVIAFHFNSVFAPAGFVGVDIFFVISGYVITMSLTKNQHSSIFQYILDFYKRRILRVMPALVVCLLLVGVISQLFIPDSWLSSRNNETGFFSFFGVSNFALLEKLDGYFSDRAGFNPFLHTWSLAVEEQFYLVFPLFLLPWLRYTSKRTFLTCLSRNIVLVVGVLSLLWAIRETPHNPQLAFYLLPSRFWELAAGAVLFQYHSRGNLIPQNVIGLHLTAVLGAVFLVSSIIATNIKAFPFPWAILPVLGGVALISAARSPVSERSYIIHLLRNRLVSYLGRTSYSLYLWHWPVVVMMRWTVGFATGVDFVIALVLTFFLGLISYHCIEKPFLTASKLRSLPAWRVVLSGITLTASAAFFFYFVVKSGYSLSVVNTQPGWNPWDMPAVNSSSYHDSPEATRTLWVIGDSHALAYNGMVRAAAARAGMKVQIKEVPGCSIANLWWPNADSGVCRSSFKKLFTDLSLQHSKGDIVFLASLRGQRLSDQWGMYKPSKLKWILKSNRSPYYRKSLEQTRELLDKLRSLGLVVIIDTPKPVFRAPVFRCSDWFNSMNPVCAPGFEVSKDELMKIDEPVLKSLDTLQSEYPDLVVYDPFPVLCPGSTCSVLRNGKPLFFDQDHLSGYGNQVLIDSFFKLLQSIDGSR